MRFPTRIALLSSGLVALSCGPLGDGAHHAPLAVDTATSNVGDAKAATVEEREHPEDVADYTLSAVVDPNGHTLHGTGTIRWKNTSQKATNELWFHLYLNAFKNQRSVFLREPIGQFRGNEPLRDWGTIDVRTLTLRDGENKTSLWEAAELHRPDDEDETDVRVPLPREILPGESIELDMAWDEKLPTIVERTGYDGSYHFFGQWFPKLARLEADGRWAHFAFHHLAEFYADFGTYDVTIDVPEAFSIGATGSVVDSKVSNGRRVERRVQNDVHDFAFTTWDKWKTGAEVIDGVGVSIFYPPGCEGVARRELETMRFALPYYKSKYGPYPYKVLTLVHPPETARESGGMEYPTLITTGGPWYTPAGLRAVELVTIHEFGHQYFFGLFASNENAWPFPDEGLNSYAEQDAMRAWKGQANVFDMFGLGISNAELASVTSRELVQDTPVAQSAETFATGKQYGALVYGRTATILETIRRVFGDDVMAKAFAAYRRRARFQHPTPNDLITSFSEADPRLGPLLRTALFDKGWADYSVVSVTSKPTRLASGIFDRDGKRETVTGSASSEHSYDGSVLLLRKGTLALPVEIDLVFSDGSRERRTWDGLGESTRMSYRGPKELKGAVLDPEARVLLDQVPENNGGVVGKPAPIVRTIERLAYWGELLVQLVTP